MPLAKGGDQQHHWRPIDAAVPKTHRRRQHAATAARPSAAQAEADFESLFKIGGTTSWLSLVVSAVQRAPAVGQFLARACWQRSRSILYKRENNDLRTRTSGGIIAPAIYEVIVAGAPYYALAKEREGAPSFLPRCSCLFFIIFPSFFWSRVNDQKVQSVGLSHGLTASEPKRMIRQGITTVRRRRTASSRTPPGAVFSALSLSVFIAIQPASKSNQHRTN